LQIDHRSQAAACALSKGLLSLEDIAFPDDIAFHGDIAESST
jgi:hypothetical protein